MNQKKFYITTPIYYPSDKLHIGHTYCTVATDAMARYKRLQGYNVKFLTGTDEHGQKIELKAKEAGVTPQQFVDNIVEGPKGVKDLWKLMNISYDRFIRTTDDYHVAAIQKIFKKMYEKGDIYKGKYVGKYCTPCESFWTESQLVNGCCPDCGRPVVDAEEEAYFFRLSKYADRVRDLLVNTDFLLPRSRVNEMVHNFIDPGLEDLCVSRTSFKWGIPVDFDPKHVVYVWIDALFNYTTALGFMNDKYPDSDYETFWPADVHFIGKEIVRFHSIIWPAMLMSMDMPLPKHVYGHGWLLLDGGKMSKSKGNVVDPYLLAERYSADALRYFLLRDFPFGSDGNFSNELLINRINMDLANDLGNLLSRTTAMADKYFGGNLPIEQDEGPEDAALLEKARGLRDRYEADMEAYAFQNALADVFEVIDNANKYIDATAPWVLAKSEDSKPRLARVLYNLAETLRICTVLLQPFMPTTCEKIFAQLNVEADGKTWDSAAVFGTLPANATVAEAMQVLVDRHISAAPLVDEQGKAVGFVSDGDIMRYLSKRSQMLMDPVVMIMQTVDADGGNQDFARKLDELMGMPAKSIGAKGIIGVDVHADLPEVCRVLGENHLKKVPVLDEGQVVGVINRSDITHYSMQQYLAERDAEAASKLERSEEAAALPDDEAMASSI